ncbi:hypothetical protein, variant [Aphanomyces invadans]|uniref:Uncharacterized protein n=1 Tax=Aphanomyces invadans TaxID=157072 RepID=A0A024UWT6_9STRA|nr:hypothetical protein, variant [Aphanomyces invadans]ETW10410.1 hypothetical protein, variant [Aphanomyces invadans]|eukprot:XP_008861821.1 hypothetical protein, variant [Aphanomyces invadans]
MSTLENALAEGHDALIKLQHLTLRDGPAKPTSTNDPTMLREYTESLERKLAELLLEKERNIEVCKASAECTFAKNYAGRVLVAIFDHAMGAKVDGLKTWWETGNIQTRSGPGHWRLDPRALRDKRGFNLLHVTMERNLAKESAKVAQIDLLVDTMRFDVNSTDLVGRTSLHHAAMNGYEELVIRLLAKNSNPLVQDHAGMTALGIVQQIAGASERIIQALLEAEKTHKQDSVVPSASLKKSDALVSVYFILRLEPYISSSEFRRYVDCATQLRDTIQAYPSTSNVPFDAILRKNRMMEILENDLDTSAMTTEDFEQHIAIEASRFSIYSPVDQVTYAKGSWVNFLQRILLTRQKRSYGNSPDRHTWYYAALFQAQVQPLPGHVDVQKGHPTITSSSSFAACLPLESPVLIQGRHYWITAHMDSTATLDRPFEGATGLSVQVYSTESAVFSPYVGVLELYERVPGNKYDKADPKDEMVQQYQRIAPDHVYEVGVQIGPTATRKSASDFVKAWRDECKQLFQQRQCISGAAVCAHSCPQKLGAYMCRDSMEKIGVTLAQTTFGRSTYAKTLTPRAILQGSQDMYKGTRGDKWPGCQRTLAPSH